MAQAAGNSILSKDVRRLPAGVASARLLHRISENIVNTPLAVLEEEAVLGAGVLLWSQSLQPLTRRRDRSQSSESVQCLRSITQSDDFIIYSFYLHM